MEAAFGYVFKKCYKRAEEEGYTDINNNFFNLLSYKFPRLQRTHLYRQLIRSSSVVGKKKKAFYVIYQVINLVFHFPLKLKLKTWMMMAIELLFLHFH